MYLHHTYLIGVGYVAYILSDVAFNVSSKNLSVIRRFRRQLKTTSLIHAVVKGGFDTATPLHAERLKCKLRGVFSDDPAASMLFGCQERLPFFFGCQKMYSSQRPLCTMLTLRQTSRHRVMVNVFLYNDACSESHRSA
jgi:hypothetical protein